VDVSLAARQIQSSEKAVLEPQHGQTIAIRKNQALNVRRRSNCRLAFSSHAQRPYRPNVNNIAALFLHPGP
jgi:hypothetical protein